MPFLGTTGGGSVKQFGGQANLGYFIKNSLRFRASNSAYLSRTPGSSSNRTTWTWSGWVKRGALTTSATGGVFGIFGGGTLGTSQSNFVCYFNSNYDIYLQETVNNVSNQLLYETTSFYRDPSAWYHIIVAMDTTQATAANRVKIYVNGVQAPGAFSVTPGQNQALSINNTVPQYIGGASVNPQAYGNVLSYFDGYITEVNFIDGQQLTPSSFGKTDAATNQWVPKKFAGTYGTNGYYLKFADASAPTAAAIGKDSSGNGNNWTPSNISVTSGTTYDAMIDSPTRSAVASNYCTLNPLAKGPQWPAMQDGNLRTGDTIVGNYHQTVGSTFSVNSGKWYWEIALNGTIYNSRSIGIALINQISTSSDNAMWNTTTALKDYRAILLASSTTVTPCSGINGTIATATNITLPSTLSGSNIFMVALDVGSGAIWFGLDGTWLKSATTNEIVAGTTTNAVYSNLTSSTTTDFWTPAVYNYIGASSGYGWIANFGQRPFSYTPPTGFKSLNTFNLP